MSDNEHRQLARDSLFVMAELRIDGVGGEQRIRVRNLSSGGLMAEGDIRVQRGQLVWIKVRNIGWVEGSVAWVQDNRFGIAFREEIDPKVARAPMVAGEGTPRFVKPAMTFAPVGELRKI
ncbi:PilZ domain-containing protein [Novosphingobium sp.]|uniref:PilZ domain-containing protein n=1 Tax=Novosphingobium sp. TaxID=1874826 RepID=UPI0027326536|nr:PilZ domain-containing protein [Novosphingobium sp.]MDP3907854.1 PilZ domain-containing protein [Novosphingobium sp.]